MSNTKKLAPVDKVSQSTGRKEIDEMRTLILDIETFPVTVRTWRLWEADAIRVVKDGYILSVAHKWLGEKSVKVKGLCNFGYDQKKLTKHIWDLFDEADVIVGHNANKFDVKRCQADFLKYGFGPVSPFKIIDTLTVVKRHFKLDSYKLDSVASFLGFGHKKETGGFDTWEGCERRDKASWAKMLRYNKHDVLITEQVYMAIRPYITTHPNHNVFNGTSHACPNCGSGNTHRRGLAVTRISSFIRYQCQSCGAWSRGLVEKPEVKVVLR